MTDQEWKERYINRFIEQAGLSREEAEKCYEACENHEDDPELSADMEMSYWEPTE